MAAEVDIRSQPSMAQHVPTRTSTSSRLLKPIAIPAVTNSIGSPFLRAYPPFLESYGISRELFLKFLDDFNRVAVKNPPLIALTLAGKTLAFVPLPIAQITSAVVITMAASATLALSKGRSEIALRKANRTIFNPCGLKVEIGKMDALAKIASIPVLTDEGKVDDNLTLLQPLEMTEGELDISSQQRRLQTLAPYIAALDVEPLPEIEKHKNPFSRWSVSMSESQRKREEKRLLKKRDKVQMKFVQKSEAIDAGYDKDMAELLRREDQIRGERKEAEDDSDNYDDDEDVDDNDNNEELKKALADIEQAKLKIEQKRDDNYSKIEKSRRKNDKEEKGMRKILWIIIRNVDAIGGADINPDMPDNDPQGV